LHLNPSQHIFALGVHGCFPFLHVWQIFTKGLNPSSFELKHLKPLQQALFKFASMVDLQICPFAAHAGGGGGGGGGGSFYSDKHSSAETHAEE
jgi:hypothetical protein